MFNKLDGKNVEYILKERAMRGDICGIMQILKHCKKNIWNCKLNLNELWIYWQLLRYYLCLADISFGLWCRGRVGVRS